MDVDGAFYYSNFQVMWSQIMIQNTFVVTFVLWIVHVNVRAHVFMSVLWQRNSIYTVIRIQQRTCLKFVNYPIDNAICSKRSSWNCVSPWQWPTPCLPPPVVHQTHLIFHFTLVPVGYVLCNKISKLLCVLWLQWILYIKGDNHELMVPM